MVLTPMFLDKFVVLYEPMEERVVQDLTWHGLPIPELAPKVTTSTQLQGDVNRKGVVDRVVPNSSEATSSRARTRSVGRQPVPSAPLVPPRDPFSTFAPIDEGIEAHEVPLTFPTISKPTVRISMPREEASVPFSTRSSSEPRRVRPADFQKWVKKFNGTGDPYDHLASFK